jgi:AraC-like DNA-binding protein
MIKEKTNNDFKYVENSFNQSDLGVVVNTVGFQQIAPNTLYPPICHPKGYYFNLQKGRKLLEFQLIYITSGGGILQIESKKYTVSQGDVFLIFPGQWHTYTPDNETGWNEYYIGFSGNVATLWIENSFFGYERQLYNIGLNEELVRLFKRATELAKFENQILQLHLSGIVYHMIGLLISEINNKEITTSYYFQIVERAKIIMNENISNTLTVEELSDKLNVNYTSFRKQFKAITGFAPKQYILELKISKGKQMLLETSLSIKEIAQKLQYSTSEHFTTTFKNKTGCTPKNYREFSRPS